MDSFHNRAHWLVIDDFGAAPGEAAELPDVSVIKPAEGEIFAETAGGVTVGVAKKLIASGAIPANDSAVLCITGNGLKTLDAVIGHAGQSREIKPSLREFEALLEAEGRAPAHA